jgi:putative FmdB family regulatory protein
LNKYPAVVAGLAVEEVKELPTYEYKCGSCSCCFELRRSFNEDESVCCPECGADAQRIFTPVPIIFKGNGFYVTDHRGNHGHPSSGDSSGDTKAGSKEDN